MSPGVVADPVAALLPLVYDLGAAALQRHRGVASRVHRGMSVAAQAAESGGGVDVVQAAADEAYRQRKREL